MADDTTSYGLLLPFDSDDPEFVRGFEAGAIWARMQAKEDVFTATIHSSNAEMVIRMAEQAEYRFEADYLDDTWVSVHLESLEYAGG